MDLEQLRGLQVYTVAYAVRRVGSVQKASTRSTRDVRRSSAGSTSTAKRSAFGTAIARSR